MLGDDLIRRLLLHPKVAQQIPELRHAAQMMKTATRRAGPGCRSCGAAKQMRAAFDAAKQRIASMPPNRMRKLKKTLGIQGQRKVKMYVRKGARVVPIVM